MIAPLDALVRERVDPDGPDRGRALLVPGFTGSKEDFAPLLPLLATRGWAVTAYSQRGQFRSWAPVGVEQYRLEDFAGDAAAMAESVGAPVHLLGHSLGGLIARAAVIARPELFASLTILCSGPGGQPWRSEDAEHVVRQRGTLALWDALNPDGPRTPRERLTRERAAASSVDNYLGGALILRTAADTTEQLRATGVPVLVAHGVDDAAWPHEQQRDMAQRLGARYEIIADAAHSPAIENPPATAELLDGFWAAAS